MKTIITIGRQYGSGGREIGEKLAKALNIPFYDKNLLKESAKGSDFSEEVFDYYDEQPTSSLIYSLFTNRSGAISLPLNQQIFLAQFDTIKRLAKQGSCVIIGRCADYALSDYDNVINIFIHSSLDARVKRICKLYNLSETDAKKQIAKRDKQRSSYYNYFTDLNWGSGLQYDYNLNSAILGIDNTVEIIKNIVEKNEAK